MILTGSDAGIDRGRFGLARRCGSRSRAGCARSAARRAKAATSARRKVTLSGALATVDAEDAEHVVRASAGAAPSGKCAVSRRHRARRLQHVDQQIDHQRRGDEVEHDRGDDDVAAALGLQLGRDEGPGRAEERRRRRWRAGSASGQCGQGRGPGRRARRRGRRLGLALAADVEQAGVEGDRDGEAGEDEVGGVVERDSRCPWP